MPSTPFTLVRDQEKALPTIVGANILPPDDKLIAKPFAVPMRCGCTELLTKIFNARNAAAIPIRQINKYADSTVHKIALFWIAAILGRKGNKKAITNRLTINIFFEPYFFIMYVSNVTCRTIKKMATTSKAVPMLLVENPRPWYWIEVARKSGTISSKPIATIEYVP